MAINKFFKKHKDYNLLIVGFILTTLGGSIIGATLQKRNWNHQHRMELYHQEKKEAQAFFNSLSDQMDGKLLSSRKLHYAVRGNNENKQKTLASYAENNDLWLSKLNSNYALLNRYFGEEIERKFKFNLKLDFHNINSKLKSYYIESEKLSNKVETDSSMYHNLTLTISRELNVLDYKIYKFDSLLLANIKEDRIGINLRGELIDNK